MIRLVLLLLIVLTGCTSYKEPTDYGLVLGMAIDYDEKKKEYEVTLQMVNPKGFDILSSGGDLSVMHIHGKGKSLGEAARNSSKEFSRLPLFSHLTVILLSEKLAKEKGINFILDVWERDAKVRSTATILVARESSARETLSILPVIDATPSVSIVKKLQSTTAILGENVDNHIYQIIASLGSRGSEPVINGIKVVGNRKQGSSTKNEEKVEGTIVKIDGVGLFKDGFFVGWLNGEKAKALSVIKKEKMRSTNVTFNCNKKEGTISAVTKLNHTNTKVTYNPGLKEAHIQVHINGIAYLNENLCNLNFEDKQVLKDIEKALNKKIEKDFINGIQIAQKHRSDVFGFGDMLYRKNPDIWKKAESDWNNLFSKAKVDVDSNVYIYGTGMRNKAYPF